MQIKELNKKQIILVALCSLCLVLLAAGLDLVWKQMPHAAPDTATPSAASPSEPAGYRYGRLSSRLVDIEEETPYEPGPDVLNLAYYYPEDADASDVINSYAGRLYTELTTLEAEYMSRLYDLADRTPSSMARELGISASRVMGKYNPNDTNQDPENPATWTVNSFKNTNIAFYDGDGNRINAYSVVKEIMSMASVYSYYHGMYDYEGMREYALSLWERSHSYSISMGNVYYDSGCLHRTIEEEAQEAVLQEEEEARLSEELAASTRKASGESVVSVYTLPETDGPGAESSEEQQATLFYGAETDLQSSTEADVTFVGANASEESISAQVSEADDPTQSAAADGSVSAETDTAENGSSSLTATDAAAESVSAPAESGTDHTTQAVTETAAQIPADAEATFAAYLEASGTDGLRYRGERIAEAEAPQATLFGTEAPATETVSGETTVSGLQDTAAAPESVAETEAPVEATLPQTAVSTTSSRNYCPGHVDLYVTVTIYGLDDQNGLMKLDTTGQSKDHFNSQWQGWTDEMRSYAQALNSEDWFTRYGLTISAINVRNPLSQGEIDDYLSRLSDDVSDTRREIISFALHSVGKVPYYWGGKPSAAQYENNRYGTIVAPDSKGRVLRGLDCSGWINWVYWSVLGSPLPAQSTGTLIGIGQRIRRDELRPGDIIVRTGADAHVVMFLCWTAQDSMLVIHETGGVTNNVTVSEMSANWPYYRSLLP